MADSGGGVVDPYPSARRVFGAAEEGIGESGIAPVYPSNGEGVLFSHKFVGPLLTLAIEVAIGELVAVEGGGGRGRRPMWTSLGAKPVAALTELL